jgi:hypothetical protein
LNPFRLDLAIDAFRRGGAVPSVEALNAQEPIWPHELLRHRRRFPSLTLGADVSSRASWTTPSEHFVGDVKSGDFGKEVALVAHANCQVTTQDEDRTCGSRKLSGNNTR